MATLRQLCKNTKVADLYVVVQFIDDKSVCTVPIKRVDLGEASRPELASIYPVQWTGRNKFDAEVLAIGTKEEMFEEESSILERRNDCGSEIPASTPARMPARKEKGNKPVSKKTNQRKQTKKTSEKKDDSEDFIIALGSPAMMTHVQTEAELSFSCVDEEENIIYITSPKSKGTTVESESRIIQLEKELGDVKERLAILEEKFNQTSNKDRWSDSPEMFSPLRSPSPLPLPLNFTAQPPTTPVSSLPPVTPTFPHYSTSHVQTDTPTTPVLPVTPTLPNSSSTILAPTSMPNVAQSFTPLRPVNDYSPAFLIRARATSCSRGNFAANLNRSWFSVEERLACNVRGRNGKKQLSPRRVQQIYDAVFHMYPLSQNETIKEAWSECIKAIDVANRQLKKRGKEN